MDIKRARVFVVEDEKVMQTFVLSSLRRLGILDLFAFDDGAAALRESAQLKPDLIVTDVHMQTMGGIAFVRALRAHSDSRVCNTPVIFLSADSSSSTVAEALPLGVQGYLVKPPNWVALGKKIEAALRD
jgi:two-component system chemotaxis response regulator CheY